MSHAYFTGFFREYTETQICQMETQICQVETQICHVMSPKEFILENRKSRRKFSFYLS